uniref:hypothetical protein n=1 Tax=Pseudomonas aeruginosa TaxID=287 RepID=UPI00397B1672
VGQDRRVLQRDVDLELFRRASVPIFIAFSAGGQIVAANFQAAREVASSSSDPHGCCCVAREMKRAGYPK